MIPKYDLQPSSQLPLPPINVKFVNYKLLECSPKILHELSRQ